MAGIVLVSGLAVAACGPAQSSTAAAGGSTAATASTAASTGAAASSSSSATPAAASSSSAPAGTGASASATSSPSAASPFAEARSEWVKSKSEPLALLNVYYSAAATDLKQGVAAHPGYQKAISDLKSLAGMPDSNATATQIADAQVYRKYLNTFFGTANG